MTISPTALSDSIIIHIVKVKDGNFIASLYKQRKILWCAINKSFFSLRFTSVHFSPKNTAPGDRVYMDVPSTTASRHHVVVMPYPGRGHINPIMNLCKLLVSKNSNILVTFVVTEEWLGFIGSEPKPNSIQFGPIPNVIPSELGRANNSGFIEAVMTKMEAPFEQLLDRLEPPPKMIIYDSYLFWVVDVGNRRNIPVASFWPMSASFFSACRHYHLHEQNGDSPVNLLEKGDKRVDYIPGISSTRLADLPLDDGSERRKKLLHGTSKAFHSLPKAQYLLIPSVYELEPKAIQTIKSDFSFPIYTIALANPEQNDKTDLSYLHWLDSQPNNSVLYISQGSFLSASRGQMDEIAAGLRESGVRFLWIAREEASELEGICGKRGLVLPWCDQLRVLSHPSIGGFWSHCGWNSTREGLFIGVPFLTFPIVADQLLNGKMIVEDWKVGRRVKEEINEVGTLVRKDEIVGLLQEFMDLESDLGKDMRKRAREVKQICHQAIASGGSSEVDLNYFVKDIIAVQ